MKLEERDQRKPSGGGGTELRRKGDVASKERGKKA